MFEDYLVMPEGCEWTLLHNVASHESAYSLKCCLHSPKTRIAIMNVRTKETKTFIRGKEKSGNLIRIIELKGDETI